MICRITGKIQEKGLNYLVLGLDGLDYEVFIPACVMQSIEQLKLPDGKISLLTHTIGCD